MSSEPKNTAQSASPRPSPQVMEETTTLGTPEAVSGGDPWRDSAVRPDAEGTTEGSSEGTAQDGAEDFDWNRFGAVPLDDEALFELRKKGLPRVPTADFTRGAKRREELRKAIEARHGGGAGADVGGEPAERATEGSQPPSSEAVESAQEAERVAAPAAATVPRSSASAEQRRKRMATAVAVLIVGLGLATLLALQSKEQPSKPPPRITPATPTSGAESPREPHAPDGASKPEHGESEHNEATHSEPAPRATAPREAGPREPEPTPVEAVATTPPRKAAPPREVSKPPSGASVPAQADKPSPEPGKERAGKEPAERPPSPPKAEPGTSGSLIDIFAPQN